MRMQQWTPETIRFMREADAYCGFSHQLSRRILPRLSARDQICDAGCGLGLLSMELSPHVRRVTAVDRNAEAIHELESEIERRGISNIDAVCTDLCELRTDAPFDAMIFCLFGGMNDILTCAARLCGGTVVVIQRRTKDELWLESYGKRSGMFGCASELESRGIPFEREEFSLALNQPFGNIVSARAFLTMYAADMNVGEMTDEQLLRLLYPAQQPGYRYELPVRRNLEMYTFRAKDIVL